MHLAASALLVEAAVLDGHFDDAERATIERLLAHRFDLSAEDSAALCERAAQTLDEKNELYGFTRTLKDRFDFDERVELMEMMWQVVYADGEVHDYEANLMRRVAGLLYVSDQDSGAARKRVLNAL